MHMSYVLTGCSDEMLASMLAERRRQVKEVEQEIARRREERFGFPHWYCPTCNEHYRAADGACVICGEVGQKLTQSEMAITNG